MLRLADPPEFVEQIMLGRAVLLALILLAIGIGAFLVFCAPTGGDRPLASSAGTPRSPESEAASATRV